MSNENQNITVFLNEEYDYRHWVWTPEMTKSQFIDWWKNLTDSDIIKYYFNIKALPGSIAPVNNTNESYDLYCHFHDVDDSFIEVDGTEIPHSRTTRRDWKDNWVDYQIRQSVSPPIL